MTYSTVDLEYPYTQEPVSKLGETGGTVVYIFPDGDARVKKGKKDTEGTVKKSDQSRFTVPKPPSHIKLQDTSKSGKQAIPKPPSQIKRVGKSLNEAQTVPQNIDKTIGDRLVEAGVISSTQLQVALYDQQTMSLSIDEILIARGWIDQNTIEMFSFD
ncbi:MAG: hypothetical protein F6K16_29380 [Symploca sp. SIO2B6]|nr:hypothetical protein [Symploca sp. SIO2B6]